MFKNNDNECFKRWLGRYLNPANHCAARKEKHVDLLLIGEGGKNNVFLSKIFMLSCMISHYIHCIFVAIVCTLSLQLKY